MTVGKSRFEGIFTEASTEKNTEISTDLSKEVSEKGYNDSKDELIQEGGSSVREQIIDRIQKEPTTRKTIDIPDSLNTRLRRYCADKGVKTERRVFLVLLESFLKEEGY